MPVCIVCKPHLVPRPKRIAPFDTGAFASGLFADYLHPKMTIDDFLLGSSPDMPGRVVALFFASNRGYFSGKPATIQVPPMEFEASSYYSLISDSGMTRSDDRRSTIEIQTDQSVSIAPDSVLLVVLPRVFLDDSAVRNKICKDWSAEVRTYATMQCDPREYQGLVFAAVEEFLNMKDYI